MSMAYIALYRRWRPECFADLVGQEHISHTLSRAVATGQISHAYLFTGPRGTGKTSTAKILARALNCAEGPTVTPCGACASCRAISDGSSMDVFEIDAASNRGIDEIRDLRESVKFAPTMGRYKIYIIDEVHMLTTEAFNALLKTLEEPPARVIFILATTEPHKVPATIQSRCQRYDFHRITAQEILKRLIYVCKESGIVVEEAALSIIAMQADGGMRDALSILDQCMALAEGTLTAQRVQEVLGLVGRRWTEKIARQIAARDAVALITELGTLLQNGCELRQILSELALYFRSLMIARVGGALRAAELTAAPDDTVPEELAQQFTQEEIMQILRRLNETLQELRTSPQPRIAAEVLLIELCHQAEHLGQDAPPQAQTGTDDARIARLEAQISRLTAALAAVQSGAAPLAPSSDENAQTAPPAAPAPPKKERRAKRAGTADAPLTDGTARELDMAVWQKFQAALKVQHKLAYSLLSGAAYEGMTKTHFFIRPSSDMARDYIKKRHHGIFEEIMTTIAGRPMSIICTGGEEDAPPAAAPPAPEYPAPVKELLKIAGEGAEVEELTQPTRAKRGKAEAAMNAPQEEMPDAPYEPTPEEEAEMMGFDELPPDENT